MTVSGPTAWSGVSLKIAVNRLDSKDDLSCSYVVFDERSGFVVVCDSVHIVVVCDSVHIVVVCDSVHIEEDVEPVDRGN